MRVLVNALPLRYGGGVSYLQQQMAALSRVDPNVDYHTLISPWTEVDGLPGTVEAVPVRSVAGRFAYEQLRLPFRKTDVLYCPANFAPMVGTAPTVLTIQNANYYRAGLSLPETARSRPKWKVLANHWAMRRADAIVAISHAIAEDAIATVPGISDKVHVIHSGAPTWPAQSVPIDGLPERYVVSVTSAAPHKRVDDVVEGWARSRRTENDPMSLVLIGGLSKSQTARHRDLAGRHASALIHLGWVGDRARLKWIYEHASAMISMSLLEAFPLTPAEAGSVGCPLVLSDIPAHREVTNGNAIFIAPRDRGGLADAIAGESEASSTGARPWQWDVTWDENARKLGCVFDLVLRHHVAR